MEQGVAVVDLKDRALTELFDMHRVPGWIDLYPLSSNNVYDYFRNTPFFDRNCNNEFLGMQHMDSKIKTMTGVEYEVAKKMSSLGTINWFVIYKQCRLSPTEVRLINAYYVVGVERPLHASTAPERGTVIPLPDIHSVLATNLRTTLHYLQEAVQELHSLKQFNLGDNYSWDLDNNGKINGDKSKDKEDTPSESIAVQYAGLVEDSIMHWAQS